MTSHLEKKRDRVLVTPKNYLSVWHFKITLNTRFVFMVTI